MPSTKPYKTALVPPPFPKRRYDIIVADPPWRYGFGYRKTAGVMYQYPTLTEKQLAALPIAEIAHRDTYLALWVTGPKLDIGIDVMRAWGFRHCTLLFTWVKVYADGRPRSGVGHHTNANAELVLLGHRVTEEPTRRGGKRLYVARRERLDKSIKQIILAPVGEHSAKPPEMYDRLRRLYQADRRIDLFGRTPHDGYDRWGLEAPYEHLDPGR